MAIGAGVAYTVRTKFQDHAQVVAIAHQQGLESIYYKKFRALRVNFQEINPLGQFTQVFVAMHQCYLMAVACFSCRINTMIAKVIVR